MKKNTVKVFLLMALGFGFGSKAMAQTPEEVEKIRAQYNLEESAALSQQLADKAKSEKAEALRLAEINGWPVTRTLEDGTFMELMRVNEGKPVYYRTLNHGSATLMNVDDINSGGSEGLALDGQDMIIGEWDGGAVKRFHQDLTAARVEQKDNATTAHNHATHVAGTMIGSGAGNAAAKGMAPQAKLWANDWNGDVPEMIQQASEGLLISNHSYGRNVEDVTVAEFGQYNGASATWDNMTFMHKYYQPVIAAGNDRNAQPAANPSKNGRDLLFDQAVAKNVIVVGAVDQAMSMSSFSNWGPTDDRRIKPDIVAKGVNVMSTWANGADYMSENGTSMASPGIAGSLLLLQQHFNNENGTSGGYMRSATLRGLMAHTARDLGEAGPDHIYGWGLLNAQAAADVITNNGGTSLISELSLANNSIYTLNVTANGAEPLVVTLAWTDRPHAAISGLDNVTPALINDLDIKISKGGVDYLPWRLNTGLLSGGAQHGDNTVDNIEKIQLYNPANTGNTSPTFTPQNGEVFTITIKHKGNLFSSSAQEYSLIVSGISGSAAGVDDNVFASGLNMWPNPAHDVLNISTSLDMESLDVVVYDIQGRRVAGKNFTNSAVEKTIDISGLVSGMYIVEFSNGNQKTTKKLLKK